MIAFMITGCLFTLDHPWEEWLSFPKGGEVVDKQILIALSGSTILRGELCVLEQVGQYRLLMQDIFLNHHCIEEWETKIKNTVVMGTKGLAADTIKIYGLFVMASFSLLLVMVHLL